MSALSESQPTSDKNNDNEGSAQDEPIEFAIQGDSFRVYLVDTVEKVGLAVSQLLCYKAIAVDLEGVDLSRIGSISLIQISPADSKIVFLFDITILKERAFYAGLFQLLTEKTILKIFFDVRGDCDALYHQYHFTPAPIVDCQIAMMCAPRRRQNAYVIGLKKAFKYSTSLSDPTKEQLESVKEAGLRYFAPEFGGSHAAWDHRPLSQELLVYAGVDVWYLNIIFVEYLRDSGLSLQELQDMTKRRILRVLGSEEELKGPKMAERDF